MSEQSALQKLIFERLTTYAPLVGLIGQRVYDKPAKDVVSPYISFGPQDFNTAEEAECVDVEVHTLQLDCWSVAQDGKQEAQAILAAMKRALHRFVVEPQDGALVSIEVVLVRVVDDPDGITVHGIMQVEAVMEAA